MNDYYYDVDDDDDEDEKACIRVSKQLIYYVCVYAYVRLPSLLLTFSIATHTKKENWEKQER